MKLLKLIPIFLLAAIPVSWLAAQQPASVGQPPAASPTKSDDSGVAPSWETQKQARTFILSIPAPRGQITDRNGKPLAQTRVANNLAIEFPTPLKMKDAEVLQFAHEQIGVARGIIGRHVDVTDDEILKHYHNRGVLPLTIALDLLPQEKQAFDKAAPEHLVLQTVYLRFYQNGPVAAHIIGYPGRNGHALDKPIENNDLLWPETEGREGIESTFNAQLTGKLGQLNISLDATGKKVSEKVAFPPVAGNTVVTTIDLDLQILCEQVLSRSAKRGAIVIADPNNGDILAMASWPVFNPNRFVPEISKEEFDKLQNDPEDPLLPRAYRSAYPPGSTFKVFVGIAALESGAITLKDQFDGPAVLQVGNTLMHNWRKDDAGQLDFHEALEQSCDTWFYQVGIKTGSKPIIEWADKFGFGAKTGIPIRFEAEGRVPTDEYMLRAHGRKIGSGDIANISIGQGDVLVTPLQMAQAMVAVANGGTLYRLRLVKQVQGIDNHILTPFEVRIRADMNVDPVHMAELRRAMVDVVSGPTGTGHKAGVDKVDVAGKTGTAQWGPRNKERNAAWFVGFASADKPKYAFAAVYEGEVGQSTHGGDFAAPMMGKILNVLFQDQEHPKKKTKQKETPKPEETARMRINDMKTFAENRYDTMIYRKSGKWGLKLPAISLGAWETFGGYRGEDIARECMYRAFDLGITHFDLANNYGRPPGNAEVVVGHVLKDMPRDELIISTKAGYLMWPGPYGEWGSRKYLIASLDQSLKRMGLDYVDIFYSHRPDPDTPLEETIGALEQIVRSGKALYAGISSYSGAMSNETCDLVEKKNWPPITIHQPQYNMLSRGSEADLIPVARKRGFGIIAFSPLANGFLTSKYLNGVPPDSRAATDFWSGGLVKDKISSGQLVEKIRKLNDVAKARGQSLAQMALAWILRFPEMTSALIGASKVSQIEENVAALSNLEFSAEELKKIDSILE